MPGTMIFASMLFSRFRTTSGGRRSVLGSDRSSAWRTRLATRQGASGFVSDASQFVTGQTLMVDGGTVFL